MPHIFHDVKVENKTNKKPPSAQLPYGELSMNRMVRICKPSKWIPCLDRLGRQGKRRTMSDAPNELVGGHPSHAIPFDSYSRPGFWDMAQVILEKGRANGQSQDRICLLSANSPNCGGGAVGWKKESQWIGNFPLWDFVGVWLLVCRYLGKCLQSGSCQSPCCSAVTDAGKSLIIGPRQVTCH